MKKLILFLFGLAILGSCSDDESTRDNVVWNQLGLEGLIVNELVLHEDLLFAATDDGLFRKHIDGDDVFTRIGFENMNLEDLLVFSENQIMVSFVDRSYTETPALYYTTDGGTEWDLLQSNFGGESPEPIFDLAVHPLNSDVLYGAGLGVVAKSTDKGLTWEPIWGQWEGFATGVSIVTISPQVHHVWAGGQGAIENGFLLRTSNEEQWTTWDDLVPNPTVVKEIKFVTDEKIYAGFEGALLRSSDNGDTWKTLIDSEENKFFFGIGISEQNPDHVFAGGWIKGSASQALELFVSENAGDTWRTIQNPEEEFGGIYDMLVKSGPNGERIFLGLYKGGVYEVTVTR